jgi:hypothetical protein
MDKPTNFIWPIILFDETFKYGMKFWESVGTKAEPLCIEFYNSIMSYLCKLFNFSLNNAREVGRLLLSVTSCL